MAKYLLVFCSLLFFILMHWALSAVSARREWWPPHGTVKEISGENVSK
uniref:Serine peptidase inhibitor Kazal type 14 (putative) n=1 Tax=Ailuropoda melanoleuca TaxID=9646 RepID=A0A7N5K4B7_AILME